MENSFVWFSTVLALILNAIGGSVFAGPIKLAVQSQQIGSGRIYHPCSFNDFEELCFLDTGALKSAFENNETSRRYPTKGTYENRGATGSAQSCDVITITKLGLDATTVLSNFDVLRCDVTKDEKFGMSKLALDALSGKKLHFDFKVGHVGFSETIPKSLKRYPILMQAKGHLGVSVSTDHGNSIGVWDTGAAITVVDKDFIARNPGSFVFIQNIDKAGDANGKAVSMKLYQIKRLQIGTTNFKNLYVASMDFGPLQEIFGKDVHFIVGFNAISKANWYLDLQHHMWAVQSL